MIQTKEQIIDKTNKATFIDIISLIDNNGMLTQNNIIPIDCCYFHDVISNLPYDNNNQIDVDIHIMNKEEYCNKIITNHPQSWERELCLLENDIIAVIIIK